MSVSRGEHDGLIHLYLSRSQNATRRLNSRAKRAAERSARGCHRGRVGTDGLAINPLHSRPLHMSTLQRGCDAWLTYDKVYFGVLMCSILPCIGLQVLDDGVAAVTLEDAGYKGDFVGPREEQRSSHISKGSHIGAEHVRQRQQSQWSTANGRLHCANMSSRQVAPLLGTLQTMLLNILQRARQPGS